MERVEFSRYNSMSPANAEFYFLLSNLDAFYFSACLITVARTSSTMLNKSG